MSKGKVKVSDICLNISFLTSVFSFFYSYMKKSSKSSLKKKGLLIYLSSIKMKLAINFLKKKLLHLAEKRAGAERVIEQFCKKPMGKGANRAKALFTRADSTATDFSAEVERSIFCMVRS